MIERILAFRKRFQSQIEISFVDTLMCVSLASSKNHFEIKLFGKDIDRELELIHQDLMFYFGMIEEFDLNTRIWTKQ